MADILKPDLCVIGAGALGIELVLLARQRGLGVVLVEGTTEPADALGGSLRHAALLASADRAQALRTAPQVGLDNAEPRPNFRTISERAAAAAASVTPRDAEERLVALGVTVLRGPSAFIDRRSLRCGETTIRAAHYALTTGSAPMIPVLPGLDQVSYFTPETIGENLRKFSHLVVIGGKPEALELAQAYRRLGSAVTLVPQGGMLPGFDPELVAVLVRTLAEEGVVVLEDAEVTAIVPRSQGTGVTLRRSNGEDSLDVSHILVAMGGVPVLPTDLLDKLRLRRERERSDRLKLGSEGRTSNSLVTALGGAAGEERPHVARRQVTLLVERLTGVGNGRLNPHAVPDLVRTQPALAQIGRFELRPGETVLRSNLAENDAARASGQSHGFAKLVVGKAGAIAGAGILGPGAGETAAMLALAMASTLSLRDLGRLVLPQPSTAAVLIDLADQFAASRPQRSRRLLPGLGR